MNTLKAILGIVAGAAFGCGSALLVLDLGPTQAGIWIAVGAALFLAAGCVRYVQRSSREALRREREAVWTRRLSEPLFPGDPIREVQR